MPEFSIVIPVHNGEGCVRACVESLLDQSYGDLEVLCVDDASSDGSPGVLRDLAGSDGRVKVLRQLENGGCGRARRRGALESRGRHLLFADQDDAYLPGALQTLRRELRRDPVDILAFDASVESVDGACAAEVDGLLSWMNASEGLLRGREIVDACFSEMRFGYSIWNKAYCGDLARKAFALMEDVAIPLGEDNYAFFVLAYLARTFRSIPGKPLYRYRYGAGFTGHAGMSLAGWERTASLSVAADLMRSFLEGQHVLDEYRETYEAARAHMLGYAFDHYRSDLPARLKREGMDIALELWGYEELVRAVALRAPEDLPLLVDARFGDDASAVGLKEWVADASARLLEVETDERRLCDAAAAVRAGYERSRAYRVGRALSAPARLVRR